MKKTALSLLLAALLLLCACSGGGAQPSDTVRCFVEAFNEGDAEAMLDTIDPDIAEQLESMLGLLTGGLGEMLGLDLNMELLMQLAPFARDMLDAQQPGVYPELTCSIDSEEVTGSAAEVACTLAIEQAGETQTQAVVFELEKLSGNWYIMDMREA